jgi:hypothetical protein
MLKPWGRWKKKTNKTWPKRIWRRIYARNQNYIFFIYGPPGSGKSEAGLSCGEMLSPRFNINFIVFNVLDFFNLITSDKVRKGDFILFEEIGNAVGNRDYYMETNKWMSKVTQVIRTKNLIIGYTAPKLEMADKHILALCMGLVSTIGVDYQTQEGLIRIYDPVSYDMKTGKWNKRRLEVKRPSLINPKRIWHLKIGTTRIRRASLKLRNEYEERRNFYGDQVALEGREDVAKKAVEEKNRGKPKSVDASQISEWADEVVRDREKYMGENRFNLPSVQNRFNCSTATAKRIKEDARIKLEKIGFVVRWR